MFLERDWKKIVYCSLSIILLMICFSCKTPEDPLTEKPNTDSLILKLTGTELKSATFSLHTAGIVYPATLKLTRNSETVKTFSLFGKDTILTDKLLVPSTTYSWQILLKKTETDFLKSEPITGKTVDSTSHDFTWQIDTIGAEGSFGFDMAYISDNDIWVTGEFYIVPWGGPNGDRYNAAHWNGVIWEYIKIPVKDFQGHLFIDPIRAVFAFSKDNIWGSSGQSYVHWDGLNWSSELIPPIKGETNKIWGSSPNNIYFIGNSGSISHYNGTKFELVESGTTVDLLDISGTDENNIWVSGRSSDFTKWFFFKFNGNNFEVVSAPHTSAIWAQPNTNTLWRATSNGWQKQSTLFPYITEDISDYQYGSTRTTGTSESNIFMVGHFNSINHYNGSTLKLYTDLIGDGIFFNLSVTENKIYTVGYKNGNVILVKGTRK